MPNVSTGKFSCEEAKKTLITLVHQERVVCLSPEPSGFPAGTIFKQDPLPETRLLPNTRITLYVSNGQPTAPPANSTGNNTNNDNAAAAQPSADLSATQQLGTAGPFQPGQSVQYTIIIHNAGPADATNVRILETPTNLKTGEVTGDCKTFPCTIPNLARDSNATIKLTASIDRDGPFQSEVAVTATEQDLNPGDNTRVTGGLAALVPPTLTPTPSPTPSPTPAPSLTPPPAYPDPWVWLILILAVGGGGLVASGGTAVHIIRKRRRRRLSGSQPPTQPSPQQPPPTPAVDPNVVLRPGKSEIESLQMAGPQIRLHTDLRMGGTTFDGPVPIVRKEVRNE